MIYFSSNRCCCILSSAITRHPASADPDGTTQYRHAIVTVLSSSGQLTPVCRQGVFKNGGRRHEEADFGSKNTSASLPRRLPLWRRFLNSPCACRRLEFF